MLLFYLQYAVYATVCAFAVFLLPSVFTSLKRFYTVRKNLNSQWPGPKGNWFWGSSAKVIAEVQKDSAYYFTYIKEMTKQFPQGFRGQLGPIFLSLNAYHPNMIKAVLCAPASDAPKLNRAYKMLFEWLGHGLLVLEDKVWFRHRRLLTPSFHFEVLKPYVKTMNESAHVMVENWLGKTSENKVAKIEIFHSASLMTLDTILKCLMSYQSNCQEEKSTNTYVAKIYQLSNTVVKRMRDLNLFKRIDPIYYLTKNGKLYKKLCDDVHKFSESVIDRRNCDIGQPAHNGTRKHFDFLDTLLKARDSDGKGLSDSEIRAEVDTFMFEGHDTTASGISWTFYCLAMHPEHQEKCFQEIKKVMADRTDIEWNDLSNLPHLTLCIKESLRQYPPVPIIFRKLNKDIEVDGKTIVKDTDVILHIYALHHHEEFWKDPHIFDPSRFTQENMKSMSSYAYVPFSAGPRNCIGQRFAMNEIKIAVAQVLSKFQLKPDLSKKIQHSVDVIYRATTGLYLKAERRV
nr:cytochrome P450 4F4-like isoform X1 [Ciona intestinalis]|eukprot:XP_009859737.1 cytochrome P450 4F4-like isoform X1 [Ciona intestinalis]